LPNVVTRGASDLGLTVGSLGFFPAMDVVRQALPPVQASTPSVSPRRG